MLLTQQLTRWEVPNAASAQSSLLKVSCSHLLDITWTSQRNSLPTCLNLVTKVQKPDSCPCCFCVPWPHSVNCQVLLVLFPKYICSLSGLLSPTTNILVQALTISETTALVSSSWHPSIYLLWCSSHSELSVIPCLKCFQCLHIKIKVSESIYLALTFCSFIFRCCPPHIHTVQSTLSEVHPPCPCYSKRSEDPNMHKR